MKHWGAYWVKESKYCTYSTQPMQALLRVVVMLGLQQTPTLLLELSYRHILNTHTYANEAETD